MPKVVEPQDVSKIIHQFLPVPPDLQDRKGVGVQQDQQDLKDLVEMTAIPKSQLVLAVLVTTVLKLLKQTVHSMVETITEMIPSAESVVFNVYLPVGVWKMETVKEV